MEKKIDDLWRSLDNVERTDGIPSDASEREREDRLLRLMADYVAAEDELRDG